MSGILIYGAYGYTGELVAERAVEEGLRPILAGRSAEKLLPLAGRLGLPYRVFALDDSIAVDRGLEGIAVVAHCAGPYRETSKPMADACIRRPAHYLDISGELDVFEALRARHEEAAGAGVMLLPGAGMDVMPGDCLAAHVARQVASPVRLRVAVYAETRASRGSTRTIVQSIGGDGAVRRAGRLEAVPMFWKKREFDFAGRKRQCATFPLAELVACHRSTGIGDIETYLALPPVMAWLAPLLRPLLRIADYPGIRPFIEARIDAMTPGQTIDQRAKGQAIVVAEVEDDAGVLKRSTLHMPDPYTLTARAMVLCLKKAIDSAKPGFQTPSTAFGSDAVLEIEGVLRE